LASYVEVPSQDNDQLAAAVAQQPVPVCIEADTTVFQYYSEGVLDSDDCGTELDHCVEIVGYDTEAWIVRNSWGADWGLEGHVRIKKESGQSAGICGIALEGVYPKY
jgi:C1A family cysteine protease